MNSEEALKLINRGGLRLSTSGRLFRVFMRKYGICFIEEKQVYKIYEPFIGSQRQTTEFNSPDEVKRYIEERYHGKK